MNHSAEWQVPHQFCSVAAEQKQHSALCCVFATGMCLLIRGVGEHLHPPSLTARVTAVVGGLQCKMSSTVCVKVPQDDDQEGNISCKYERFPANRWLAHNAILLSSLWDWEKHHVADPRQYERPVAEGLAAAAAAQALSDNQPNQAAAALGPITAGLPLQRILCDVPCTANLVSTLADVAPQLTSLWLRVANKVGEKFNCGSALQHALARLTGLQDLTLGLYAKEAWSQTHLLMALAPALQHLTRLTALDLVPGRHAWAEGPICSPFVAVCHLQLFPERILCHLSSLP